MGRLLILILLSLILIAAPFRVRAEENACFRETRRQERQNGIPAHLLAAVASVESGTWNEAESANIAWPWTVMAEGEGRRFKSRRAAISAVRRLQKRGVQNIDVGCMQINLMWHPEAFSSLEAAFDPARNVAYAAEFMTRLKARHGTWKKAVRHYHSRLPKGVSYRRRVLSVQADLKDRFQMRQVAFSTKNKHSDFQGEDAGHSDVDAWREKRIAAWEARRKSWRQDEG